jgi:hypothetical protein
VIQFSVVVPLYNKAAYVRRALASVLAQTVQDFEIIVVNDGSTDGGEKEVRQVTDPRIRLIDQANAGVSAARNRGIVEAQAPLVAFLDADDEWQPEFLATIRQLAADYPGCGAYATGFEEAGIGGAPVARRRGGPQANPVWRGRIDNYCQFAMSDMPPFYTSSIVVPRHVFAAVGGFPVGVRMGEDLDTWLRIGLVFPIAYSSCRLAVYHQEADNRACQSVGRQDELPLAATVRRARQQGLVPAQILPDVLEYVNRWQIQTAAHCVMAGDRQKACALLTTCRTTRRFRRRWSWWRFWAFLPAGVPQALLHIKQILRQFTLRAAQPARRVRLSLHRRHA